ncbi:MAG: phospholipid carrier-dependent glycosyltransferase [Gordonia sp. (in: high G+C Gram-positive bacteria)]|uniref:dolichyl-phosphate-mannose--protein mannosyltransferase n=1 Tax=Gordonia sp. (in: high G+C Gram-positive bacteria) TaxID=84139 RepID=UPI0039E3F431
MLGSAPAAEIPTPLFGAPDRLRGTVVGIVITVAAVITRFWDLNHPTDKGTPVFDEKHYVPQAWQVLTGGNWIEDNPAYGLVVHPPVGKWMLAASEAMFGYTPLGWRFVPALCGVVIVLSIYLTTRRLSRSTLIGALAGLFALCDGVLFVQSRMGMLDIIQVVFVVLAFSCLIADRDQVRARMHRAYLEGRITETVYGPRLGFRWYRFTAGVMLGLACGTKWSGIYFVVFFTLMSLGFDVAARRAYHVPKPWKGVAVRDLVPAIASLSVLPMVLYLASFAFWFRSETSVYRYVVGTEIGTGGPFSWVPAALRSFWYYQSGVLEFHAGLTNAAGNHHPWESKPWTWPMGLRPMLYAIDYGPDQCGGSDCVRAQMLIGTPALWWVALPVLVWAVWRTVFRRDWRYAAVLVGYGAALAPWFGDIDRQMYFFYATAMAPFLMMGIALACGDVLASTPAGARSEKRMFAVLAVSFYAALVVVNFAWLWPILVGAPISDHHWNMEIWLPSWG